jgi:hypothetical protein
MCAITRAPLATAIVIAVGLVLDADTPVQGCIRLRDYDAMPTMAPTH